MEAHSSISGRGLRVLKPKEVKKETMRPANDELPINLGLEIGTSSLRNQNFSSRMFPWAGKSVLTMSQLDELRDQFLIHKHLAAGLRVPTHLLVPIWKSFAKTVGSNIHGNYERHCSSVRFSPLGFNNGHMMDPEPGRCRRTDGKKWRCSRDTIPHQKYCERHMHRGRNRSRKPVEASETNSPSKKTLVNNPERNVGCLVAAPATSTSRSDKTTNNLAAAPATSTSSSDKTTNNLAAAPATTASRSGNTTNHLVAALSTTTSRSDKTMNHFTWGFPAAIAFPLITEAIITSPKMVNETITSSTHATSTTAIHTSCVDAATTITMVPASANNIAARFTTVPSIKTSCVISLKDVCSMSCGENCSKSRNDFSRNILNVQKIPSSGFGFSPNSVLQGCSSSCNDNKINIELELGRCRRTDGKKWRCRRDIIPNQKYCELHMHRGSKRHLKSSEKRTNLDTSAATSGLTPLTSSMLALPKAEPATLNTNLSMSIQAGDKQNQHEESNVSCSSETTITDTTITA